MSHKKQYVVLNSDEIAVTLYFRLTTVVGNVNEMMEAVRDGVFDYEFKTILAAGNIPAVVFEGDNGTMVFELCGSNGYSERFQIVEAMVRGLWSLHIGGNFKMDFSAFETSSERVTKHVLCNRRVG